MSVRFRRFSIVFANAALFINLKSFSNEFLAFFRCSVLKVMYGSSSQGDWEKDAVDCV